MSKSPEINFKRSTFICQGCGAVFPASADKYLVEDSGIFALCACGARAPEAWWMENLRQGADKKTGPRTPEGKQRSSLNAVTHGQFSNSYLYPRKPEKYPECDHCQDREECLLDSSGYCHRKAEIFYKYFLAIKSGDPDKIRDLVAHNLAGAQQLLNHLLRDVHRLGTVIDSPILGRDSDGATIIMEGLVEYKANPSVSRLIDLLARLGMTLPEFGITPKGQKERELLQGHLTATDEDRRTADEYRRNQAEKFSQVFDAIKQSQELRKSDTRTAQILSDFAGDIEEENKDNDGAD